MIGERLHSQCVRSEAEILALVHTGLGVYSFSCALCLYSRKMETVPYSTSG